MVSTGCSEVFVQEEKGGDGEAMEDLTLKGPLFNLLQGHGAGADFFGFVPIHSDLLGYVTEEDNETSVALDGGVGADGGQYLAVFANETGFFPQFTCSGRDRILTMLDQAAGDLPGEAFGAEPELLDHDDLVFRRERDGMDPVAGIDDEKLAALVARLMLEHDGIDLKDPAIGMEFPGSFAPEVGFVRVSCHERN